MIISSHLHTTLRDPCYHREFWSVVKSPPFQGWEMPGEAGAVGGTSMLGLRSECCLCPGGHTRCLRDPLPPTM